MAKNKKLEILKKAMATTKLEVGVVTKSGFEGKKGDVITLDFDYYDGTLVKNMTSGETFHGFGMAGKNTIKYKTLRKWRN